MAAEGADGILVAVKRELATTPYACSSLRPLTGGTCNFIYHGVLNQPLSDGTREVVIKHGEGFVASHPGFRLTTSRCVGQDLADALPDTNTSVENRGRLPGSPGHFASSLYSVQRHPNTLCLLFQPGDQHSDTRVPTEFRQLEILCPRPPLR